MADAGELSARATLSNADFLAAIGGMSESINGLVEQSANQFEKMQKGVTGVIGAIAEIKALAGIGEFVDELVGAARQANALEAAMKGLWGPTEDTAKAFEEIKDLQLHSLFSFEDVLGPAAKQMALLGIGAEQTTATMKALVDAAAGLKQGPQWITQVSDTLANMSSHLVVTQRDMKALSQEGINAWGALADAMGVSINDAMAAVKHGTVDAATAIKAVTAELGTTFDGAAQRTAETWAGGMHLIEVRTEEMKIELGRSILGVENQFQPVLDHIATLIDEATKKWESLSQSTKDSIIIFTAAAAAVGALAIAVGAIGVALALIDFNPVVLAVAALAGAFAVFGKWVYDEWPAITAVVKQAWEGLSEMWGAIWNTAKSLIADAAQWISDKLSFLKPLATGLEQIWHFFTTIWKGEFDLIKDVVKIVGDAIGNFINQVKGWATVVGGILGTLPGADKLKALGQTWNEQTAAIEANKKAAQDNANAATKAAQEKIAANNAALVAQQKQLAADKLQAEQDKENAKAQAAREKAERAAEAAAKKAQEEQAKYAAEASKAYEQLKTVSPEVAAQFQEDFGAIDGESQKLQKSFSHLYATMTEDERAFYEDAQRTADAYKTLGVTSTAALQNTANEASKAYQQVANSGLATTADISDAFDKLVATQQKLADHTNNDLSKAYQQGKIDADAYYQAVVNRAQDALDAEVARYNTGLATAADVAAKREVLEKAASDQEKNTIKEVSDAYSAFGLQTEAQLTKSSDDWIKWGQTVTDTSHVTAAELLIMIDKIQAVVDNYKKLGETPPPDLVNYLNTLKAKLGEIATASDLANAALKKMGLTPMDDVVKGVDTLAQNLVTVKNNSDGSVTGLTNVYNAQKKLTDAIQAQANLINQQWTDAVKNGEATQVQADVAMLNSLAKVAQQYDLLAATSAEAAAKAQAAWTLWHLQLVKTAKDAAAEAEKPYQQLGIHSEAYFDALAKQAIKDYEDIAAAAGPNSLVAEQAWVSAANKIMTANIENGVAVTEADKNEYAKRQQDLKDHLDITKSQWQTAYDGVKTAVSGAFDELTKKIVTGDGSFSDIITKMWQGIAESALNAFIQPVTTAIEKFIATTIADLIGGQGLGGVLQGIKDIGSAAVSVFSGTAKAAGGVASGVGGAASGVGGAAGGVGGAAGGAGGVAGAAGSLGSAVSIVGAVGAAVSAISSVVGNFQMARQETTLNAIESNTRYTALYVGGRADQGILGILFKIDEEIAWGAQTKAVEDHRDLFKDWSGPVLSAINTIRDMWVGTAPYIVDAKVVLEDIRDVAVNMGDSIMKGLHDIQVTINAGNLTTAEAARTLGDQIAKNLSTQLVATR